MVLGGLGACSVCPMVRHPRPELTLPPAVEARYELAGAVIERSLVPLGGTHGLRFFRGGLSCGSEHIDFHLILPPQPGPTPFVLCLPILAGGRELMWIVAEGLAERGYAVAWAARVQSALKPPQRGADLERLLRRTLLHNRALLAWARQQPEIDATRTAALGISLGGMVCCALLALEPDLRAGALCLAGGDLPDLLLRTGESRAKEWLRWRLSADGIAASELRRELALNLQTDPALLGPHVDTDRVFLVHATLDEVVPRPNQDLLWESLGRPRRMSVPLGHYSAALALDPILDAVGDFFAERFAGALIGDRR